MDITAFYRQITAHYEKDKLQLSEADLRELEVTYRMIPHSFEKTEDFQIVEYLILEKKEVSRKILQQITKLPWIKNFEALIRLQRKGILTKNGTNYRLSEQYQK